MMSVTRRRFGALALSAAGACAQPRTVGIAEAKSASAPALPLAAVKSWAYQLQHANFAEIARSPYDLIVTDNLKNGDPDRQLSKADVRRMQARGRNQPPRKVLAYMSIGEAEDYRFYWQDEWIETATPDLTEGVASAKPIEQPAPSASPKGQTPSQTNTPPQGPASAPANPDKPDRWISDKAPTWLQDENESWGGNFGVKYWEPGWQELIFGRPEAYLERVIEQGFDGIYLDRVDAYYDHVDERPSATDDMIDFVVRLAAHARKLKPDIVIVPQNGEELLLRPEYVAAIDAIAKEDLLFGSPTEGEPNSPQQIANSLGWLSRATLSKRPIFVIEYLDRQDLQAAARAELEARGFIAYFGPRSLDRLVLPSPPAAAPAATKKR